MTCDRCGRLKNRATGRCVCEDYAGDAPAPVSTTHPPANAPISAAAAFAVLDVRDRPTRPVAAAPHPPAAPAPPLAAVLAASPAPSAAPGEAMRPAVAAGGAPIGVIVGREGRRRRDLVVYSGCAVVASRGAPRNLAYSQLAAQDPVGLLIVAATVDDVAVREDALGGRARIRRVDGSSTTFSWLGARNQGLSAENLLAGAFPRAVDNGGVDIVWRILQSLVLAVCLAMVAAGTALGLSLLAGDPTPPAPVVATVATLPPGEQAARGALGAACATWMPYAAGVPSGDRPDPRDLRPVVDGIRPLFDTAAGLPGADGVYGAARDEIGYLQEYARRPPATIGQESISRLTYAMTTISGACRQASGQPGS